MRVVQIREVQPVVAPSLFIQTIKTFAALAVCVALYILLAAAS